MPWRQVHLPGGGGGGGAVLWGPEFGEGVQQVQVQVLNLTATGETVQLAGKDTWIDNIALCPIDTARDGTDLLLEGVAATRKDVWLAWDLSTLPAGATVTTAALTVNVASPPSTGGDVTVSHIPNGSETWDEVTWRCSTGRTVALTAVQTWVSPFATAGDKTVALNAACRTRIASRMGAGFYTLVLTAAELATVTTLESADQGANNELGPRLTVGWVKTLEA